MTVYQRYTAALNRFLNVPSSDPDDARRRKLLNIILGGLVIMLVTMIIVTNIVIWFKLIYLTPQDKQTVYFSGAGLLTVTLIIYGINRNHRIPGWIASGLFLIFFMVVLAFSDTPDFLAYGRSVFVFALPIVMASVLLTPASSFLFAILSIIEIIILTNISRQPPNSFAMAGFMILAVLSWLSARSLELALRDLRTINANLDRIVQERTRELSASLSRERIESGRGKAILESIADGVIVFDLRGAATVANPSLTRLLDLPAGELVGTTIEKISQSRILDAHNRSILTSLLTSPGQQLTSYRIQWGKKTLSVTSAQVNDTEGARIGTVAVFRDYTREAEVERMKNTFLAIVSHELRTPLNAILGYAEMLKESVYGTINEKQIRVSDRIMTNSRRLLDIVSDLLDQAQMEAGKLTIHVRPFRPAELLENVHGVMDKIAADKGMSFTTELDPVIPEFLNGDAARLQQILVNLTNNAIKFTEKGGIHLRIFRADKKHWSLAVKDTGIGIPEDELPTIFEAFRQVDSTATRKYGGFGLGLTIVKQLAELMGGNITVASMLGQGSTFTVTLPLSHARSKR